MAPMASLVREALPVDAERAVLVGRAWRPDVAGPSVIVVRGGIAVDVSAAFPTVNALCEHSDPATAVQAVEGEILGGLDAPVSNTPVEQRDGRRPWLLARRSSCKRSRRPARPLRFPCWNA